MTRYEATTGAEFAPRALRRSMHCRALPTRFFAAAPIQDRRHRRTSGGVGAQDRKRHLRQALLRQQSGKTESRSSALCHKRLGSSRFRRSPTAAVFLTSNHQCRGTHTSSASERLQASHASWSFSSGKNQLAVTDASSTKPIGYRRPSSRHDKISSGVTRSRLAHLLDICPRLSDNPTAFGLARPNFCNLASMPRNNDSLAALDFAEKLRKARFRCRRLNLLHNF